MRELFEPALQGAADLLTWQLEWTKAKEHPVQVSRTCHFVLNC
jgi:hypothetical protein